jgi:hypothetical protein
MTRRTAFRTKYPDPVADADATGFFHVYPSTAPIAHEITRDCWCFPVTRTKSSTGENLKRPVFVHQDFYQRGNA